MTNHPRVFVSHASEDKERFVLGFGARLRNNGVDAWIDRWEISIGDSLVDRIFEEGIGSADAVIIVLSAHSVQKPWVREELNASMVSRIEKGTRILPVVLDDCNVPIALSSTLWIRIANLEDYNNEFSEILAAVFGKDIRPPLGAPPPYAVENVPSVGSLTTNDARVLRNICAHEIVHYDHSINPEQVIDGGDPLGLSVHQIQDSVEALESAGYLKVTHYSDGGSNKYSFSIQVTTHGMNQYCEAFRPRYPKEVSDIAAAILNEGFIVNADLVRQLALPEAIVDHVLNYFEQNGYVKLLKTMNNSVKVVSTKVGLRRLLE